MACAVAALGACMQSALEPHPVLRVREQGFATPFFPGQKALLALGGTWLLHRQGPPRHVARAIPASVVAVAVGGAVLVGAAVTVTSCAKPPTEPTGPEPMTDVEELNARSEELRSMLPTSLEEALKDFEGDFSGPWRALGLEACDPSVTEDDIRMAYRKAVRLEHPDTSEKPDAEERFQRIRKAYALLSDEGSRELLLEAIEQEASCFAELSGFDSELQAKEEGKEKSSFPWCLLLLVAVLAVLFLAVAVGLSSPDMQLRPVPKEPAVYSLEADLKR